MKSLLILGCGHPDCGDDAAGLLAAGRCGGVCVHDPTRLIELWDGQDVVLVDAVVTGSPAGTLHVWDGLRTSFAHHTFRFSTHAFGVAEAIELSRVLGRLPLKLTIYGIEGSDFTPGSPPGRAVLDTIDRVVKEIAAGIA